MLRRTSWCMILLFSVFISSAGAQEFSQWMDRSFNMGRVDLNQWKWPKPSKIEKFFPLGFSVDGWFAYSPGPGADVIEFAAESCPKPPCDRISLLNITCGAECYTDAPSDDTDKCYCPMDVVAGGLTGFGVKPLKNPLHGTFPARIEDDTYHIDLVFKEKAIFSVALMRGKKPEPMFPGTEVFLVSKKLGRQPIGLIDHNHSGIFSGSVNPAGWIKSPYGDRIVVVLAYGRDEEGNGVPTAIGFKPFPAHLKMGFEKPVSTGP